MAAYFAAIDAHNYPLAWRLGKKAGGITYAAFVRGFSRTTEDTVTIISVSGNKVTARLSASQTNGTVEYFNGVYTTADGVIMHAQVRQTR